MGKFWNRFFLENGQRMSKSQVKKVARLEEEILDCISVINHYEKVVEKNTEEISRIRNGKKQNPKNINSKDEFIF